MTTHLCADCALDAKADGEFHANDTVVMSDSEVYADEGHAIGCDYCGEYTTATEDMLQEDMADARAGVGGVAWQQWNDKRLAEKE